MVNSIRFLLLIAMGTLSLNFQAMEDTGNAQVGNAQHLRATVTDRLTHLQTVTNAARATYNGALWAYEHKKSIFATGCIFATAGTYGNYRLGNKVKSCVNKTLKHAGKAGVIAVGCYLAYRLANDEVLKQLIINSTNTVLVELASLQAIVQNGFNRLQNQLNKARIEREELAQRTAYNEQVNIQTNQMVRVLSEQQGVPTPLEIPPRENDSLDKRRDLQHRDTNTKVKPKTFQGCGSIFTRTWSWLTTPSEPSEAILLKKTPQA